MGTRLRPWMIPLRTILDIVIFNGCYLLGFLLRFGGVPPYRNLQPYITLAPYIAITAYFLLKVYGLEFTARKRWSEIFYSITCVVFITFFFSITLSFVFRGFAFPRTVFAIAVILQLMIFGGWRYYYWKLEKKDFGTKLALIVGNYSDAAMVAQKLLASEDAYHLLGLVTDVEGGTELEKSKTCQLLGSFESLPNIVNKTHPDIVIICSNLPTEQKIWVVNVCLNNNTQAYLIPNLYEILFAESTVDQIDDVLVFEVGSVRLSPWHAFLKKVLDVGLSFIGLVIFLPVMIVIYLLIKVDSPGPVIYKQKRVGKDRHVFYLFKFRTMIYNAEEKTGPVLASEDDPRITKVGGMLRKYRLDELPQLYNVLKGDMSLVGPRPERPYFVEQFLDEIPDYYHRMQIKSGLTGLAQIAGKYSTSPEDKLRYDLLYAQTYSPIKDLKILFQTIKVLMMRNKAS